MNRRSIDFNRQPGAIIVHLQRGSMRISRTFVLKMILLLGLIGFSPRTWAQEAPTEPNDGSAEMVKNAVRPGRGVRKSTGKMTPEREVILLNFARENHPELASLMERLKAKSPQDYQAALTELDRTAERLFKSREKDPGKYETQLAEWKNLSRIRLLEARWALTDDKGVENDLRLEFGERLKLRVAALQAEREFMQTRLEKLNQQIGEMTNDADSVIDKQLIEARKKLPSPKTSTRGRTKKATDASPAQDKNDMKNEAK